MKRVKKRNTRDKNFIVCIVVWGSYCCSWRKEHMKRKLTFKLYMLNKLSEEVIWILADIYDEVFSKNSSWILAVNYLQKKLHQRSLTKA